MADTDKLLSALSNRVRRNAMRLLMDGEELCLCRLMEELDVAQSNMSRHMRNLKLAGLVKDQRKAQWVHFRLSDDLEPSVQTMLVAVLALPEKELAQPKDTAA